MNGTTTLGRGTSAANLRGARLGARFGVLVGCSAWIVVLGVICAATGRSEHLLPVILPLLLASLGLGLLVLVAMEPLLLLPPEVQERCRVLIVLGGVWAVCGILLLLAEGFVVPVLEGDQDLAATVRATGGVLSLPRWIAVLLLALGVAQLVAGLRRLTPREPPAD